MPADLVHASLADRYQIERELGRGGMATVYLARDLRHERWVALKLLRPDLAATLGPDRFLREIRTTARLQHPHILPVFDSGEAAGGVLWYTMPYVEGESLGDRLRREGQLPLEEAVRLTREVASALQYAHDNDIVHRDIKPENILLTRQGEALVADFGVARAMERSSDGKLTDTGMAVGTPTYMSPEQASAAEVDGRSDIYALGCVLYEMLAGEPPFTGPTPQAILAKRVLEPVPHIRTLRESVSDSLEQAISRALARAPADRFQSASDFARALSLPTSSAGTGSPAVPSRARSAASTAVATAGLYLLAALAVLGLMRLATSELGLPDWVFPGSVALLAIGLPIVLATALVQHQHTSKRHGAGRHWLTWRKAIGGGVLAFAGLSAAAGGYLAMRSWGIGPMGTLQAAGVLNARERLLLADFGTRQVDSALGEVLTEAIRIDLAQSRAVTLVPSVQVAEALRRMNKPARTRLDPALAREVALREGVKGVVTGEVAKAGTQYVLSAQLITPTEGEVLTAHRVTASDSTDLIGGVDRLSKVLRAKIGEPLRSVNREPPLERVTTASLPALRQYSAAVRTADYGGHFEEAIARLEEAIALDTGFAMAYRTLGMHAANLGKMDQIISGYSAAMKRLDRLTERERNLTLGDYHLIVTAEFPKAVTAYRAVLEDHPDDREALNNLGIAYSSLHQNQRAESLYQRAIAVDSSYLAPYNNLMLVQIALKRLPEAEATYERARRQLPDLPLVWHDGIAIANQQGDYMTAASRAQALKARFGTDPQWRADAERHLAIVAATGGRLKEAERHLRSAMLARAEASQPDGYLAEAFILASLLAALADQPHRSIRELESAVARYPLDSMKPLDRPYLPLARATAMAGRADRARRLVAQYERVPRSNNTGSKAEVDRTWGHIALAERRWPEAIAGFRDAISGGALAVFVLPELGRAYDLAGQTDSAIALYERYLDTPDVVRAGELDAVHLPRIHLRLGSMYEGRGEPEKARAFYARFIELWKDCDPEFRPRVTEARRALERLDR